MRPGIVIGVLVAIALVTALALRYGVRRLDGVVASTVERYGGAVTGTAVNVGGVDLELARGRAELARLTIGNPSGYDTDYAVRIERAEVAIDVGSLAGDVPVVEELTLDDALINAEQRDTASNLTDIQRHATESSGEGDAGTEQGRIIIERFRLTNARVFLTSEHLSKPEELVLREVVVEGIGRGLGGASYSEAAEAMLGPVLAAARSAAGERLRTAAADAAAAAAREELEEQADDEAREEVDEVRERVEQLLDRG